MIRGGAVDVPKYLLLTHIRHSLAVVEDLKIDDADDAMMDDVPPRE